MEIFSRLIKNDVKFVIAGGIAVNLLGVPRFTADLDLIIALDEKNALKFAKCMDKLGYKPKVPVKGKDFAKLKIREMWIKEKNMIVFSFWKPDRPYEVVDVFVREPFPFSELWKNREKIKIDNLSIPVISMQHLLSLKREANRAQDLSDIEALKKLKKELNEK